MWYFLQLHSKSSTATLFSFPKIHKQISLIFFVLKDSVIPMFPFHEWLFSHRTETRIQQQHNNGVMRITQAGFSGDRSARWLLHCYSIPLHRLSFPSNKHRIFRSNLEYIDTFLKNNNKQSKKKNRRRYRSFILEEQCVIVSLLDASQNLLCTERVASCHHKNKVISQRPLCFLAKSTVDGSRPLVCCFWDQSSTGCFTGTVRVRSHCHCLVQTKGLEFESLDLLTSVKPQPDSGADQTSKLWCA